jgi:hypothetical protein
MALPATELRAKTQAEIEAEELLRTAHRRTVEATPAEMAAFFQRVLGQRLTALMTGIADPKAVGKWARGERKPHSVAEQRLRAGYHAATLITLLDGEETARAWFVGMNPALRDQSPILVIRDSPDGAEKVMGAARAYLAHG